MSYNLDYQGLRTLKILNAASLGLEVDFVPHLIQPSKLLLGQHSFQDLITLLGES